MRWWRSPLGLRTSVTLAFAIGATLLAATMAVGTYVTARNYLIDQRERGAVRQAFADASYVRDGLLTPRTKVSDVLGALSPPADATVLVHRRDRWFSSSLQVGESAVPVSVVTAVRDGQATVTWGSSAGTPGLIIGVPLPGVDAEFYEVAGTPELDSSLRTLGVVLLVFAVLTAAGGALVGRWAARRVVAPLDDVASAAARIAGGELDTRLPLTEDPDLATIVGSFNSMVDTVRERIERDARFAADVSHELRSPLTAVVTSVAVLEHRRDDLPPRSQQALDLIARDLDRFRRAIEDLLELGRLESTAAAPVRDPVTVGDLVHHALDAGDRPLSLLRGDPGARSAVVLADKSQLHRALVNLFENADRHGNGLTGVALTREGDSVCITVEDAGAGVDEPDRERVFHRFVRGGSRGSLPGTGLGLSLVAETIRGHGGTVRCWSEPGRPGARFTMRLPLSPTPRVGTSAAPRSVADSPMGQSS